MCLKYKLYIQYFNKILNTKYIFFIVIFNYKNN